MKIFGATEFVREVIPEIIRNQSTFHACLITYRDVRKYGPGIVDTGIPGLTASIFSGDTPSLEDCLVSLAMITSDNPEIRHEEVNLHRHECLDNFATVAKQVGGIGAVGAPNLLVVVYVGLNALEECLAYFPGLRNQFPAATLVAVACDCDREFKMDEFNRLHQHGNLDHAVIRSWCGGANEMAAILEGTIEVWRAKSATSAHQN